MTCKWQGPAGGVFGSSFGETQEAFPGEAYSGEIPGEFQPESGLYPELYPELGGELSGETPGGGTSPAPGFCPPKHTFVDCPNPSNPFEVLDHFAFNSFVLVPKLHGPKIGRIARTIRDSQGTSTAVQRILITGHTDTIGSDDVNFRLSRQRAEKVLHHLCLYLESISPGLTLKLKFEISPCGKRQTKSKPEISRRVEVFLDPAPLSQKPNPPDHNFCSVPRKKVQNETEVDHELQELERAARAVPALPRVSLFQNAADSSHRNHFQCQASRWARHIRAIRSPNASACHRLIGPTSYDTGADIIQTIQAAHTCAGGRLQAVHIFSHSGSNGMFGTVSGGTVGLYVNGPDADARNLGGRNVTDIPAAQLADNVVVVLHGCNAAEGENNLARALFDHLASSLRSPRVFGHFNSGCAGRDNSWREYSTRSTDGRIRHRTLAPHYSGQGCCG
jgi:OmpA family